MNDPLDELLDISRHWTKLKRGSQVVEAAIEFLREHFQIDAGFFSYERLPKTDGTDYLRKPHRWFTSWGYVQPDIELRHAIARSLDFQSQLRYRKWFNANELPGVYTDINRISGIKQVGLWLVHLDDRPIGLFVLARKTVRVDDSRLISRCMAHISVVLEMVLQRRMAEEVAVRDPLTGLFNRRGFLEQFDHLTRHLVEPCTLGVLDIDAFKAVNDQQGHQAGDWLLVKVGDILQRHAQSYDGICARIGGDEFVLLAHIGVRDVYRAAKAVSGWFQAEGVNISVGCAVVGLDGADFDACYHAADQRLYKMKAKSVR